MTRIRAILAGFVVVAACQGTIPTPVYQPASVATASGAIEVAAFDYKPAGGLGPNEVENENGFNWSLQEPVGSYVQKAAAAELRQSGADISAGGPCKLSGTVHAVSINGSRYRTDINYRLAGPGYERRVAIDTPSTWDFMPADIANYINKAVSENIGQLLSDPAFQTAIRDHCQ